MSCYAHTRLAWDFQKSAVRLCSSKDCKVVHRQILWKITPSLTSFSFASHWATETYYIFLKTSNLLLFGDKRARVGQDFKSSNFLAENMPKQRVSLQATVYWVCCPHPKIFFSHILLFETAQLLWLWFQPFFCSRPKRCRNKKKKWGGSSHTLLSLSFLFPAAHGFQFNDFFV